MISEFFTRLALDIVIWVSGWLNIDLPNPQTMLNGFGPMLVEWVGSLGVFINFVAIFAAVIASMSTWGVCLLIKSLRSGASHIPVVGGAG